MDGYQVISTINAIITQFTEITMKHYYYMCISDNVQLHFSGPLASGPIRPTRQGTIKMPKILLDYICFVQCDVCMYQGYSGNCVARNII